ncbi:hypothetical protein FOYG_13351 [Fusarium oxysporum NRRL 32931]|uniref:Secreted protein n=1 Tax=Fusarium oxysporum NRRL 32931 TaxID=660029 RepID=W9HLR8_FUSOX|nr:hypothetical protein FOYG_13351 [Fusarium oxysporum NRRL 32931]
MLLRLACLADAFLTVGDLFTTTAKTLKNCAVNRRHHLAGLLLPHLLVMVDSYDFAALTCPTAKQASVRAQELVRYTLHFHHHHLAAYQSGYLLLESMSAKMGKRL